MSRIVVCLFLAAGLRAQPGQAPWGSYGHDPQHTGLSTVGAQRLETIKWSTPVDLVLSGTSGTLLIHYGSPMVTAGNTVLAPLRTSASNTYSVEALAGSSGSLLYTLPSDYTPPPHNWIPAYGPTLSQGLRLYYPGAGGTVYYRDQPDFPSGPSGQIAFYGNSVYSANAAALSSTVMISTPITADAAGNIYFAFDVTGTNPAGLTSGLARIAANGTGSWVSAAAAAQGDASIVEVSMNCAPAVSNDGSTLYFAVSQGNNTGGYLVAVNSTTLAPIARVRLKDPNTGLDAQLPDNSSASPTIGPDGDVYYGVLESSCCGNDDRGWLLHFNANLSQVKTPGAFGWDTTASVVPASLVASYQGASSYLLFTKYNNYLGVGPGGNGQNKIAVLDPNGQQTDAITGATVMTEVITVLGPTADPDGGVQEWCINSAAIDPFSASALANSEDGVVYRWDFASNSLIQQVRLTAGLGEAYTPSLIGADGAAYAINDATLFAVGQASNLTIVSTHPANFLPGEAAAQYSLSVTNSGSATTNGVVTVADILPPGFLLPTSISGSGWSCTQPAGPCTRNDPLGAGVSYPAIQLTVSVANNAPSMVTNMATVSSDGAPNSVNNTASDITYIGNLPASSLNISKTHNSNFNQGQTNATYSVVVTDAANAGPAAGKVTVTEFPPAALAVTSMAGPGWTCSPASCSRGDSLAPGASYPPITVTVTVANNATSPQINSVSVSGGGSAIANTMDTVVISPVHTEVTIQTTPPGLQFSVDGGNQQTAPQTVDLTLGAHTIAVQTLQSGPSGTIYLFSGWSDGGSATHSIIVGSSPATYTATFNTQYRLTISAAPTAGGSVSPSSGTFFDAGAAVQVVASPSTGYSFNGWTGPVASAVNASTTVTMDAPETVVANFVKSTGMSISNCSANTFALTVGQAATTPATITCTVTDTLSAVGINGLTISGLPNWLTAAVAATNLAAGGTTTLTLTPTNLAAQNPGTLGPPTILITGTPASGGGSATASLSSITLSVFPQLTVSPLSLIFDVPTLAASQAQAVLVTDNPAITEPITATPSESVPSAGDWLNASGGNTPLAATVSVTSTSLPPGVYSGAVTYGSGNAPNPPSVAVTLNVGQLAVSGPVAFNYVPGVTTPPTATLNVSAGPAAINWTSTLSGDCAWLTDNATSGLTPRSGANPVTISYTLTGAAAAGAGTHVCTLSYLPAASYGSTAPAATTTVTLSMFPQVSINPPSLTFDLPPLAAAQSQPVSVTDTPAVLEPVTTSTNAAWLSASGGNTPLTSTVTVTPSGVTSLAGVYTAAVTYASGNAPGIPGLPVTLNVGQLSVSGGPIVFNNVTGVTVPGTATLNVSAGPAAINWISSASGDCAWLTDNATSGATPRNGSLPVTIGYTAAGATTAGPGNHVCTLSYSAAPSYGSVAPPVPITVTLSNSSSPVFTVLPLASQSTSVPFGSTVPVCVPFQIDTIPSNGAAVSVTASPGNPAGIFSANLSNATVPSTLSVCAIPTGLGAGLSQGVFSVSSPSVLNPVTITLSLNVLPPPLCQFTVTPTAPDSLTNAVPSDGSTPVTATGSFTVTPGAACTSAATWTATSDSNWLQITAGAGGNGAAAVTGSFNALSDPLTGCAGSPSCTGPVPRTAFITITPTTGSPSVVQVNQPGSTAPLLDRQVTALYQSILGRDPDSGGYSFWTGSGTAGLSQMADDFLTSPEAFNSDMAVIAAYQAATGAPPTFAQFTTATTAIRLGMQSVSGLFSTLMPAAGYTVNTLYQNLLNRAPTAGESSACAVLATCFQTIIGYPELLTPVGAANNEWQSTGSFANLTSVAGDHTNSLYITMLYFVILNRDPDAGGLAYWLGIANQGGAGLLFQGSAGFPTRLQILSPAAGEGFIGSPEFQGRFQ